MHLRDRSRLYCLFKKSVWACSGQMRCDSRGFENERRVCGREVQQRQTIWQCLTELPFEKSKNNVKLCFFKTHAIGIMC